MNSAIENVNSTIKKNSVKNWLFLRKDLLRFLTCGNVDDGKSTLIGRLLHDCCYIYEDQLSLLYNDSKRYGVQGEKLNLALLVDGLQAEREQGITIDVAYRYFSTVKRNFIIADTPGHDQYTRNMVTGASTCQLAVILIDVCKGIVHQTRRHSFIAALLNIKHLVVAINKMDLVDYNTDIFNKVKKDFLNFSVKLPQYMKINFVPISALRGDNVVTKSAKMSWYSGPTLLNILENTDLKNLADSQFMRFPVQYVNCFKTDFRGYSGTISSGIINIGQRIKILPVGLESIISRIVTFDGDLDEAIAGQAITLILKDEIDISRGDLIVDINTNIKPAKTALVKVVWMSERPMRVNQSYYAKIACKKIVINVENIIHQININSLETYKVNNLSLNSIGLVKINFEETVIIETYSDNIVTGSLIFIDRMSNATMGAGMIYKSKVGFENYQDKYSSFELELNALIRNHFPHWNIRDLLS
ncbi:sulfate adenylyltransferase subunit CysN [Candidatus Pantoea edessiphila]|uniref:Sulfate adenylyltransferase subunit 1 n=1 Tax=Candidatus Pantoea edessiphila TaxID=2044610 RepID=A0A2P5SXM7_9GAMM|nr:sulfate adenylyltransferase subunit CysN [Candidatus Pantoea edessiphila]MBK4775680.1 sulfate adenylyltransferase subunit CysN [Pantoea sp. Edef]PPI87089.1 sulfate adenylyltransferase subunit CysN [Candidatus Pantoea edessiphila]